MNVLVIGDLHFQEKDPPLFNLFIEKISDWLVDKKICILLGDIQHKFKTVDREAQTLVTKLFKKITKTCKLYVLVGNHDYDNGSQFLTENHTLMPFKEWPNVEIIDKPKVVYLALYARILLVPYVPKGRFMEAIQNINLNEIDMIFAHQEFKGANMGGIISEDGDSWSETLPPIVSGHLHKRQKLGKNITYIGMPYDLGWDESDKRYVANILFTETNTKIKYIPTDMPRKIVLKLNFKEALEWKKPDDDSYYKLKVVCTKEEFKQIGKKDAKMIHISIDEKNIEKFLEIKRQEAGKCDKYSIIFNNLVQKEGGQVAALYKKIDFLR